MRSRSPADPPLHLDGCVALGANLALETCFVTRFLATLNTRSDAELVAALGEIGRAAETLDEWTDLYDYIVQMVRKFRGNFEPLQIFAREIVGPFQAGPLAAFAEWYREATRQQRRLRCVFEDTPTYHSLVRELQLRNLDEGCWAITTRRIRSCSIPAPGTSTCSTRHGSNIMSTRSSSDSATAGRRGPVGVDDCL